MATGPRLTRAAAVGWITGWARSLGRRLPGRLNRRIAASRLGGALRSRQPVLSVVVPVHNVEDYLAECLDSLLDQSLRSLEIILVDDGSTDGSAEIMADYAARDNRIVVLSEPNRGPGAARNTGTAAARGRYLTFLDADDTLPKRAYEQMQATLSRTGSDFALGAVRRVHNQKRTVPGWTRNVHAVERLGVTIDEFPEAMQDVIACNRMFRRGFWIDRVGGFDEGVAYEDHVPMVKAYLRARAFDVLTTFTYNWRIRENATSMGQQKHRLANLEDRLAAKREALRIVSKEGSEGVRAAWLGRVINTDLPIFVPAALAADDRYRAVLQSAAADFLARSGPDAWRHARADRKLTTALVAAGRWDEVDRLGEHIRGHGVPGATVVRDGRVFENLPFGRDLPLPTDLYELSTHQSGLVAVISGVRWDLDRTLHLDGWAFIRGIDLTGTRPEIEVWLQRVGGDRVLRLTVQQQARPEATLWANDPNQRYDRAGFAVAIPAARLRPGGRWQLRVRVRAAGVERDGAVHALSRFGNHDRLPSSPTIEAEDPTRIVPVLDHRVGFVLETRTDRFRAVSLTRGDDGSLVGIVAVLQQPRSGPTEAVLSDRRRMLRTPVRAEGPGVLGFEFSPPTRGRTYQLQIATEDGRRHRVAWPCEAATTPTATTTSTGLATSGLSGWSRSPGGLVQVETARAGVWAAEVAVSESGLTVVVDVEQVTPDDLESLELTGVAGSVGPEAIDPGGPGRWTLTFPTFASVWPGSAEVPLLSGTYALASRHRDRRLAVTLGPGLLARLPLEVRTKSHLVTLTRAARTAELQVQLAPPLGEDERGRVSQRRLVERYRASSFEPADQVLFSCYHGEVATDSQAAIHRELARCRVPLDLVWGVADYSVEVPAGARRVLIGSWEWYEALGRSRYICTNTDVDRFFQRREHQRVLQTFRGHPFKSMGQSRWRAEGHTERQISAECERRANAWTSILAPSAECAELYRREYRYQGEVLVTGCPRTDALVTASTEARERIRERLGLPVETTAVLYAPTWREADSTGNRTARMFDALDWERLAASLGPDHVLLLRGHPYTRQHPPEVSRRATGVIDVTRYPEVNDLIVAADVALLDYSALRFDWLLTGRPLLFFVPDLRGYLSRRPALFDFAASAPGPMLRTTAEVLAALRRLPEVSRDFSAAREECNRRFNALNDGGSTARVVAAFFDEVAGSGAPVGQKRASPGRGI